MGQAVYLVLSTYIFHASFVSHEQLSSLLPNSTQTNNPSSLTVDQLAESAYLLPMLGVNFLQNLTPSQLAAVLPVIKSIRFSTAQVEKHNPGVYVAKGDSGIVHVIY